MNENEKIIKINIEDEMKTAYIDYSMSVIVSRALPDVRDGLKPVHRRVLFGMHELGLFSNRQHKKSARIVGEVLGKYHPHGDSSVYFTMVRMAQPWVMRYPLVDGQGNFGSIDGDSPAAMRYTEAKLRKIAEEILQDLDKKTVDFQLNFDDTLEEPKVLPTRIPNLLVNGSSGIAVGMATNMPPHNLGETVDAIIAYINNNDIEIEDLIKIIKAPDFPTAGIIYGYAGVKEAFLTGRGRIVIRSRYHVETHQSGREILVVTEIPYMVNKRELIEKIAELVNEKKIEGIVYVNDESDRTGMRIVIALKKDAESNIVINNLFHHTLLQSTFSVNNITLVDGRPRLLNLKEIIVQFVKHRREVVTRRTQFELEKALERAHILEGLLIALDHLDQVIALIRSSKTPDEARLGLMETFQLSDIQSREILNMRLQRLTGLERDKIKDEYAEIQKLIEKLREILASDEMLLEVIRTELYEIKEKYSDERRTEIIYASEDFNPEDFYADEPVVITISHMGYIKRTLLSEYRLQNRGGKGSIASTTRDEDFIQHLYIATMHNMMLFFTEKGKCLWLKVYEIPEGTRTSKGRAIQNLLGITSDDSVKAYIKVKSLEDEEYINNNYIMFLTKKGVIKKTPLKAFSRPRQNGITALTIREGDSLLRAKLTDGDSEIMLAVRSGRAIRFHEKNVRSMGRSAAGVAGIYTEDTDEVIGLIVCKPEDGTDILVVSEKGYGKRSLLEDYRKTNRGGKGVKTINITEKTGNLIAIKNVHDTDNLMIINKSGVAIRLPIHMVGVRGRATMGVRLIDIRENDSIAAVAKIDSRYLVEELSEVDVPLNETDTMAFTGIVTDDLVINSDIVTDDLIINTDVVTDDSEIDLDI